MADETLLSLSPIGAPPFSVRGIVQSLGPIDAAKNLRRTVNGELISLAPVEFQKYKFNISCEDCDVPALDGIWPGQELTVDIIPELGFLTAGGSPELPARTVVPGSLRVSGEFTFYRARIVGVVTDFSIERNEYPGVTGWSLDMEEK